MVKKLAVAVAAALILAAMAASLSKHGGAMIRAASALDAGALALALGLALAYRAINAAGWGLILRAQGERVALAPTARVWLASEACRWLPGGLWSFGSRAALATSRGLSGPTVATSLALELAVTVAAWATLAGLGGPALRLPESLRRPIAMPYAATTASAVLALGFALAMALRSTRLRSRVGGLILALKPLAARRPRLGGVLKAYGFYVLMCLFNGVALCVIVRSTPGGDRCPVLSAMAGNAASWLVGFLALFAPGGLVVREACLSAMLCTWMPAEQAIAVAMAWRLVQILAEIACFAAVAARGLPGSLLLEPRPGPPRGGPHAVGPGSPISRCGSAREA